MLVMKSDNSLARYVATETRKCREGANSPPKLGGDALAQRGPGRGGARARQGEA